MTDYFRRLGIAADEHFTIAGPLDKPIVRPTYIAPRYQEEPEERRSKIEPTPLIFKPNQPSCFYLGEGGVPFRGQDKHKKRIDIHIKALKAGERLKILLMGSAGQGKTTFAWITIARIFRHWQSLGLPAGRLYQLLANQIGSKEELDEFMLELGPRDAVFIDEVHAFQKTIGPETLFHTLDDTGIPRYPLSKGRGWINVDPTISWIAATTNPGEIDNTVGGALGRRFKLQIRMEPPSVDTLTEIILDQDPQFSRHVAREIASRSSGLPYRALETFEEVRATGTVLNLKSQAAANEAFDNIGLDENGLTPEDRAVLSTLINMEPYRMARTGEKKYRMSQRALCESSGIDERTYQQKVQPTLLRNGYLTVMGGQTLTERALRDYPHLKKG